MSDTPRTDAHNWNEGHYDDPLHSLLDFAKQLERELNAANSEIERLRKANLQLREGAEEQKQRIKRLEEAGDAMAIYAELGGIPLQFVGVINAWREAKEAKP